MYGDEIEMEPDIVELDEVALRNRKNRGTPSSFIYPDCGGPLFQEHERDLPL